MSNLLTNKNGALVRKRLSELISISGELKILVGFFYFSGIKALYEALTANPDIRLRILVGMETEQVVGRIVECSLDEKDDFGEPIPASDSELQWRYLKSLKRSVNSPEFDKQNFHERFGFFLELLTSGRLQIRKTREPNHAKLYIFDLKGDAALLSPSSWITGSSNLTLPGLTAQHELNVEIHDFGTEEVDKLFEELWADSVPLTEDEGIRREILSVLTNESVLAPVTPFEAYIKVLQTYLSQQMQINAGERLEKLLESLDYDKYRYQLDAVNQALNILKEYNGVIIADVVGLGKSVIASMIANASYKRGIVISPPGLLGDDQKRKSGWQTYRNDFKLHGWELFSSGLLENALNYVNSQDDIEIVLIDEAHRFKNQDTQDYETLCNICRGRKVIMLTATPFNNRPADIFSLLRLFILPNKSKITLDNQLGERFSTYDTIFRRLSDVQKYYRSKNPEKQKRAQVAYVKLFKTMTGKDCAPTAPVDPVIVKSWARKLAREIRQILEPVTIRRNRLDLRADPDYSQEVTKLSDMCPPVEQFYELSTEQSKFYEEIINDYFGEDGRFKGAIYQPFTYEKGMAEQLDEQGNREMHQQANLYDFMRRLLVKRFESSFGSFRQSIENFERVHKLVRDFIDKTGKYVLDRIMVERISDWDVDAIDDALNQFVTSQEERARPKNAKIYEINKFADAKKFRDDLDSDIALFGELLRRMDDLGLCDNDPKAKKLVEVLGAVLAGKHPDIPPVAGEPLRKVVIFSEYADTVRHLQPILEARFPGKSLQVVGQISNTLASIVEKDFDASVKGKEQTNHYQVLLTTDKMSEGHNLHRAGLVINYDIPWNPIRVIQRVGRINRIGHKVFNTLYIFNFFPTEVGAPIARSREIATQKMFMIHNTIGEDAQIFDIDETPTAAGLYQKLQRNPEEAEQENFITRAKKVMADVKKNHPETLERVNKLPFRVKTARANADTPGLFVFKKKGLGLFAIRVGNGDGDKAVPLTVEDAVDAIQCGFDEPRLDLGPSFWSRYELAGKFHEEFWGSFKNPISLESKARNNLRSGIEVARRLGKADIVPFLQLLADDIRNYGTLPDYTLRRIGLYAAVEADQASLNLFFAEIRKLRQEMGDNYLEKVLARTNYSPSEIIIAVENQ